MKESNPRINLPPLCERHSARLVKDAGYGPNDAWRALVIATQIALFQAASATPSIQLKLKGEIEGVEALGCLACCLPGRFDKIVQTAKTHDLGAIKSLGEEWVKPKDGR